MSRPKTKRVDLHAKWDRRVPQPAKKQIIRREYWYAELENLKQERKKIKDRIKKDTRLLKKLNAAIDLLEEKIEDYEDEDD